MSARRRPRTDLEAAADAARESKRRSEADAARARAARREGDSLAERIHRFNEANGFSEWLFRDGAGGVA